MQLLESLEDVRHEIWKSLLEAVDAKGHEFRYPVIATVSDGLPLQRTVVLRNLFVSSRTLLFHTDSRSRKIQDLKNNPHLNWLFYDSTRRIQIQLHSRAIIHDAGTELHENEWSSTSLPERLIYFVANAPGTPIEHPDKIWLDQIGKSPGEPEDVDVGKPFFRVVTAEVDTMDWLQLYTEHVYRAIFQWDGDRWEGSWVRP